MTKAFHIDDTLFLKLAEQIRHHPLDFFGFEVNWHYSPEPMAAVTRNPPLMGYFLAAAGSLVGFGEPGLHLACILPAIAGIWGTYVLARLYTAKPTTAALFTLATPAFLVSSTSIMCDTMMLALWVWAIVLWIQGLSQGSQTNLIAAGVLAGLCALAKYFGISLVPLLLVYAIQSRRPARQWLPALAIPIIILGAYQAVTYALYGQNLLYEAMTFARAVQSSASTQLSPLGRAMMGLSFLGGSAFCIVFFAPGLSSPGRIAAWLAIACVAGWAAYLWQGIGRLYPLVVAGQRWSLLFQVAIFATVGLGLLTLATREWLDRRDSMSVLLWCWITGTFVFTAFVNWTPNVRSVLPAVPAIGLIVARRLENRHGSGKDRLVLSLASACSIALALMVAYADFRLADASRIGASQVTARLVTASATMTSHGYGHPAPAVGTMWFEGHWGFQHYMEQLGGKALDRRHMDQCRSGDWIVIPMGNCDLHELPRDLAEEVETIEVPSCTWCATLNRRVGAGFYAGGEGPAPFVFEHVPEEQFRIFRVKPRGAQ